MRHLSLFTGAGGGELGAILNGWHTVGYVEWNDYCQRVIAQRIKDGILPEAPIFGDVRAFISEGYAEAYQGMVDVISAGFPCQPHSSAGKRLSEQDDRNLFPETIEVIRTVRPASVILENVSGLLFVTGYLFVVIRALSEAGYKVLPPILCRACDVGANHERRRIWIVAYSDDQEQYVFPLDAEMEATQESTTYPNCKVKEVIQRGCAAAESPGGSIFEPNDWWKAEPGVPRVDDGMAVDVVRRNEAIGNGQVPAVVRAVWRLIVGPVMETRP